MFYSQGVNKNAKITIDTLSIELSKKNQDQFKINLKLLNQVASINFNWNGSFIGEENFDGFKNQLTDIRYYKFDTFPEVLQGNEIKLIPYKVINLLNVITKNKDIEDLTELILGKYGLKLIIDRSDNRIKLLKDEGDEIVALPFKMLSDGLQRHIFNQAAILSNKNSIIVMEEPESHTFPFLTKSFSEMIAKDESNQFFLTTHDPYFFISLIEKAKKDDVGIFIVYYEDYQTKVKKLSKTQIETVLKYDYDIFFNLEKFFE